VKRLALCLLLAGCVLLSGCATSPTFPEPDHSWKSYSGQLQYATPARSLIGEFVVSQNGGDFRLEFSKGGSVPLLRVSRHGELARAEGALARGRWSGVAAKAPGSLHGWVNEVPTAFAQVAGRSRIEVAGTRPGEKFIFILNR
jgi:hypothetical protein